MRYLSSIVLLLFLTSMPTFAATNGHRTCEYAGTITQIAQKILKDRADLNRIQKRRSGDLAAHLLITYGGLGQDEARHLLQVLKNDSPRRITELMTTWVYDAGTDQDRAQLQHAKGFDFVSYSALRAMLDFDLGKSFLKALSEHPDQDNRAMIRMQAALMAGYVTAGWDAARRADLVSYAIATGHPEFAAGILAAGPDRAAYLAYIQANADRRELAMLQPQRVFDSLLTVPNNTGPFLLDPERLGRDTRTYRMLQYAYTHAATDFLLIVYNQTGDENAAYRTSEFLMTEVEAGRLNPTLDPESARAMAYHQLVKHLGQDKADQALSSFDMSGPMRFDSRARDHIDWAIAVVATRTLIDADTPANRQRPDGLSANFDWDLWLSVIDKMNASTLDLPGLSENGTLVAIEVLFAANRINDVFDAVTKSAVKPQQQIRIFQEIMLRLDRRCEGYAMAPGQGIILGGQPVFRFKD